SRMARSSTRRLSRPSQYPAAAGRAPRRCPPVGRVPSLTSGRCGSEPAEGFMSFSLFMQHLANGVSLGSLYALIAIGYTMVYGILRLINFAHGDIVMVGAYVAFYGIAMFVLPWWISFPLAIVLTILLGVIIERAAYKPLREVPRFQLFTSAVAVSFLLENLAIVVFGGRPKAFPRPPFMDHTFTLGRVRIVSYTPLIIVSALILFGLLTLFIHRSKVGMAMR